MDRNRRLLRDIDIRGLEMMKRWREMLRLRASGLLGVWKDVFMKNNISRSKNLMCVKVEEFVSFLSKWIA